MTAVAAVPPSVWDTTFPRSVPDVIELMERRIEVHIAWREYCREGSLAARAATSHGVGDFESHEIYIAQYKAAIRILRLVQHDFIVGPKS